MPPLGEPSGLGLGLSAHDFNDIGRLAALAANPQGTSREEIYLAVSSLFRTQGPYLSERERDLMCDILRRLARDVEMAIRISLAERLADDPSVPSELLFLLADDHIEVARPVIIRSKLLTDDDILKFIERASEAHQAACAERPNIGEPVTDALAKSDSESVLVALIRNVTAKIAQDTFDTLVEKSKLVKSLQEPLIQREDLPATLATRMCDWVSDSLKSYISNKYRIPEATLGKAIYGAVTAVETAPSDTTLIIGSQKLIDKMAHAGQLKAGFLLRVLHQGQIELFDLGFAKLLDLNLEDMRKILYEGGPRALALACRAAGIDRCVFSTVFNLSRQARKLSATVSRDDLKEVEAVFSANTKPEAMAKLHGRRFA